jgi:hypothetical protein
MLKTAVGLFSSVQALIAALARDENRAERKIKRSSRRMRQCSIKRALLLFFIPIIASSSYSPQPASGKEQGTPALSSMTLEQSLEWLQKTLVAPGKQRVLFYSSGSGCDVTFTNVGLDRGSLTLGYVEDCKVAGDSWTQKAAFNIPLADVDPQTLSVVELEAGQQTVPNGAFILHVVMFEGKKTRTHRTWTQDGKSETKDFDHNEQELYFGSKEKAYQTVEVLRRMAGLVSAKRNESK